MSESPISSSSSSPKKRTISENNPEDSAAPSSSSQRVPSKASSNILVLNYDCLKRIFSLLSLDDQLNFSRSNRKIQRMYRNYAQWKYKHINNDITLYLEESDLEYLLEQVNEDLISYESYVHASSRAEEQLRLLRKHCPMLRRLNMTLRRPHWEDLIQLKNLHTLDASLEFGSTDVYEKFFSNLSENLPCLRKLVLVAPDYNGKGLHVLEKLQHLEIDDFSCLDATYLTDCCIKMKNLHFLKIGRWPNNLTNKNLSAIVANCRNLETLEFTCNELLNNVELERVCDLPRLKHLLVVLQRLERPGLIEGLVRRTGTPLESLIVFDSYLCKEHIEHICNITSLRELWVASEDDDFNVEAFMKLKSLEYLHLDMDGITNKQLLELVLGCPRLRVLNVIWRCPNINSDFISLLKSSLKKLKEINREKISIYLNSSSVDWKGNSRFKLDNIQIIKGSLWEAPILHKRSSIFQIN
ncbi:uncharacterized protein [Drosophila bipectinata]|uniref:uncharacterized protein n=1 Tax=Drosophila bipectinata TaxID=42026 RepID=UPI001C8AE7E3|nr:uncharacterized protein LOC108125387 [Drosophila bipectinata]XP_017097045.2 uncharacterized protein LOC108125387 [Drosophila bipectinata]XP_043068553.1 uncharacterized protein LOC108125387 [Drosophila bipectinata]